MKMQVKIEKPEPTETMEVECPYYYKKTIRIRHWLGGGHTSYGRITETDHFYIEESTDDEGIYFEITKTVWDSENDRHNYFKEENKSTQEEFEAAKQRAIKFLNE